MGSLPPHLLEFDDAIKNQYRGNYKTFLSLHPVKSNMTLHYAPETHITGQ